jgi:hypothetical protein
MPVLVLPGGLSAVHFPQAIQLCGFLYNTLRESASGKRRMDYRIAPECLSKLV